MTFKEFLFESSFSPEGPFRLTHWNMNRDAQIDAGEEFADIDAVKEYLVKVSPHDHNVDEYLLQKVIGKSRSKEIAQVRYAAPPGNIEGMADNDTEEGRALMKKIDDRKKKSRKFYYRTGRWDDWIQF